MINKMTTAIVITKKIGSTGACSHSIIFAPLGLETRGYASVTHGVVLGILRGLAFEPPAQAEYAPWMGVNFALQTPSELHPLELEQMGAPSPPAPVDPQDCFGKEW